MTEWIIPCNLTYYDITKAFEKLKKIDWKQSSKFMEVDDIIYIYVGRPVMAIMYKCRITKTNLEEREIDDSAYIINSSNYISSCRYMEIEMVKKYEKGLLPLDTMAKNGVCGSIQGVRRVNSTFSLYLKQLEENINE